VRSRADRDQRSRGSYTQGSQKKNPVPFQFPDQEYRSASRKVMNLGARSAPLQVAADINGTPSASRVTIG
jgi:hypothetical protein